MGYEVANAVVFGPIAAHYLDIVNARRPDSALRSSRRQHYRSSDRTRQATRTSQAQRASTRRTGGAGHGDTANKAERPVGSVEVDRSSLWSAADLPNHNVFAAGILHAFSPPSASNPEQQDVCHMQAEDDEESDDDQ
ncbi:hypothetical protein PI124_g4435 [Phytophthora idaei]|nr:hypothetical protein PI125_g4890 [Phytophthora idaei]KAG3165119.1 hypothetical protein PI126_g4794 [Phytophthora idaei]KAG3250955.1 hypothetical protein PI124_g4435 [Phytophthora idaei]